jgi:hypothetical protein
LTIADIIAGKGIEMLQFDRLILFSRKHQEQTGKRESNLTQVWVCEFFFYIHLMIIKD